MCDWKPDFDALDGRITKIESDVKELRSGFVSINNNIETLSQQITNMERRLIEEKQKWGDVFRSLVKRTVITVLFIVAYAAGINITKSLGFFVN